MSSSVFSSSRPKSMHVNAEHLLELFYSQSRLFDFEGILLVQRVDSRQPLARQYQECLCRLRGNLLFIAEIGGSAPASPATTSLVILNKFEIKLCEESKHFEFCLHLNLNNKSASCIEKYYFIASTRSERDKWIESIYLTSFDFLRSVHRALSENLHEKRQQTRKVNRDNLLSYQASVRPLPNRFLLIRCDNLQLPPSTIDPFVYVKVFYRKLHLDRQWFYLARTEEISSRSPLFTSRINLPSHLRASVELKFEVCKAVDRQLDSAFLVAFAYFVLRKKNTSHSHATFELSLCGVDGHHQSVGSLTFSLFNRTPSSCTRRCRSLESLRPLNSSSQTASNLSKRHHLQRSSSSLVMDYDPETVRHQDGGTLQFDVLCNTMYRKFSFQVLPNQPDLIIEEFMSESKFSFIIPQILMKLYAQDEEKIIRILEQFRDDSPQGRLFEPLLHFHKQWLQSIKDYLSEIIHFMSEQSFRPSKNKNEPFLQFVPTNFHKQTCRAWTENQPATFSVFTHGACCVHYLGYQRNGMQSIITGKNEYPKVIDCWTMLKKLLIVLHSESRITANLDRVGKLEGHNLLQAQVEPIYEEVRILSEQLSQLISVSEVEELLAILQALSSDNIIDYVFKLEPIELVYVNIQASLLGIQHKLSEEIIAKVDLDSFNRKLKAAIESLRKIVFACYLSLFTQLGKDEPKALYNVRFRHNAVCTQAITTLIIFLMDRLEQPNFLGNVKRTGFILVQHEVWLSCYNEEQGMLEDMIYALDEVANSLSIVFKTQGDKVQTSMPDIETFGDKIRLTFHLDHFPEEIAASSFECKIKSLIFNIGVNEQATLAERLGYNGFQRDLNQINYNKLKAFMKQFHKENTKVAALIAQLEAELKRPIAKNITVMQLVEDAVREMGGIRATCCKSAKDRTGMSVTLQEVRFALAHFEAVTGTKLLNDEALTKNMLDTLRRDGTRLECCFKNIGVRKYAFNRYQMTTFPRKFKPPKGTYYSTMESAAQT